MEIATLILLLVTIMIISIVLIEFKTKIKKIDYIINCIRQNSIEVIEEDYLIKTYIDKDCYYKRIKIGSNLYGFMIRRTISLNKSEFDKLKKGLVVKKG